MEEPLFTWEFKVRDYELDSLGIVNHATYLNYFEHCRNEFAKSMGIDFYGLHQAGYDLVVAGVEVKYRAPLRSGDEFYVTAKVVEYNEKRMSIAQEIRYKRDRGLVAQALVSIACVDQKTGKSCLPDRLKDKLSNKNN